MEEPKITEQQATEELNKKYDESVEILKDYIKENGISIITFLKSFPRKKRIDIVEDRKSVV